MKPIDILNKPGVISVEKGTKITKGVDTGEPCYTVKVVKKQEVADDDKVPGATEGLATDVVEGELIRALAVEPTNSGSAATNHGDIHTPIRGGISIGTSTAGVANNGTGTLAGFAKDVVSGELCGFTNNHVAGMVYDPSTSVVDENLLNAECPDFIKSNNPDLVGKGIMVTQPGPADGSNHNVLGALQYVHPFNIKKLWDAVSIPENYVDAALFDLHATLGQDHFPSTNLYDSGPLGVNPNTLPIFDFNNLPLTDNEDYEIVKIGRTTGRTPVLSDSEYLAAAGLGYIPAKAISGINALNILLCGDPTTAYPVTAPFSDVIKVWLPNTGVRGSRQDFSNSGDSGSLVCIKWEGEWFILGLVFAGTDPENGQSETFVCRIDYVMKVLRIGSDWTPNPALRNDFTDLSDVQSAWGVGKLWDGSLIVPKTTTGDFFKLKEGHHTGGKGGGNSPYRRGERVRKPQTHQLQNTHIDVKVTREEAETLTITAGSGSIYIDGVEKPDLTWERGETYRLDLTGMDATHPFAILDNQGFNGILLQGANGGIVDFTVPADVGPKNLITYDCLTHPGMGGNIRLGGGIQFQSSSSSRSSSSSGSSSRSSSSSQSSRDTDNDGIIDWYDAAPGIGLESWNKRKVKLAWTTSSGQWWQSKDSGWTTANPNSYGWRHPDKDNTDGWKIYGLGNTGFAFSGWDVDTSISIGNQGGGGVKLNDGAANNHTWTDVFYELGMKNVDWYNPSPPPGYAIETEPTTGYTSEDFKNAPWKFFSANGTGTLGHTNATHIDLCLYWHGHSETMVQVPIGNIHRSDDHLGANNFMLWIRYSTDATGNITF